MVSWEYKVVYMDFRGRASVEGDEQFIAKEERRSAFARRVMNALGAQGWELVSLQPLWPAETSYLVFKREGVGDSTAPAPTAEQKSSDQAPAAGTEAQTQRLPGNEGNPAAVETKGPVTDL